MSDSKPLYYLMEMVYSKWNAQMALITKNSCREAGQSLILDTLSIFVQRRSALSATTANLIRFFNTVSMTKVHKMTLSRDDGAADRIPNAAKKWSRLDIAGHIIIQLEPQSASCFKTGETLHVLLFTAPLLS
jgi:hypothetical protein